MPPVRGRHFSCKSFVLLVPGRGLEPLWDFSLRILSPLRLPISPSGLGIAAFLRLLTESARPRLESFLLLKVSRVSRAGGKPSTAIGFMLLRSCPISGRFSSSPFTPFMPRIHRFASWLVSSRFHRNRCISPRLSTVPGSLRKNRNHIRHQLSTHFFIAAVVRAVLST